jgi:DNA-binding phage protein
MASLGSLVVSLAANTSQFTSAMDKAAYQAAQRMDQMKRNASMAGKVIGAAFVAGAGAAAYLVKQSIDAADGMTKMAQKAGVSVESFSTMAYAAKLSGVEVGSLQSAMSKLSSTALDVARGTNKDAVAAFDALGISAADASGKLKSSDQIMSEVADRFVNMEDGAGKTALAIKIFGRSGADLIPMLNQGAAGLTAMQEEARALGVEIDGSAGPAAERFNDNLTRLNTVKQGFANQIMKAVLPSLEGLTNHMISSAKSSNVLETAARSAAAGIKILMSVGAIVTGVFKSLGEYLGGVAATLMLLFQGEFRQAFETGKSVVLDFASNVEGTVGTVSAIWDEAANQIEGNAATNATKLAAPIIAAEEKVKKSREKIERETHKVRDAVEAMIDGLDFQADTFGKSEKAIALHRASLMGANDAQIEHISTVMDFIEAKTKEKKAMEESVDSIRELQKAAEGWGNKFTDTFVDGVMKGKLAFKDLANSIISDILRIIVQKQVLNALGDFGGGGKAGVGILGAVGKVFGFDGGGYTGSGPRSGGLDGKGGFLAMMHPQETVVDHTKPAAQQPAQQPVVVNQYFTVGDVATVSMVRQAVAGSEKRIAGAMGRSMTYGGALS